MKIRWKQGTRARAKAEAAHAFFEGLRSANGGDLDLDDVVEQSRPEDAVLHDEFEWDDQRAGQLYRRDQARYLVRHIEVVRDEVPNAGGRAYESVEVVTKGDAEEEEPKPKQVFRRTEDILADPVARADLLSAAVRDALAYRRRYAMLSELAKVIEAIDQTVEKLA